MQLSPIDFHAIRSGRYAHKSVLRICGCVVKCNDKYIAHLAFCCLSFHFPLWSTFSVHRAAPRRTDSKPLSCVSRFSVILSISPRKPTTIFNLEDSAVGQEKSSYFISRCNCPSIVQVHGRMRPAADTIICVCTVYTYT